jgi:Tfp pilus assembly PilM family ATPase
MSTPRTTILAIAFTPTSADVAEVRRAGKRVEVLGHTRYAFPPSIGLDQPAVLGEALAEHLQANGISARHAVVGLCPQWVLARRIQVPPTDRDAIRGIVNLQIERGFAGSASEMAFDYWLGAATAGGNEAPLVLAGARKKIVQQAEQAVAAAGLRVEAVTPTAFAAATDRRGVVVQLEDGVAGVVAMRDNAIEALASCPVDLARLDESASRKQLLDDLTRCTMQLSGSAARDGVTLILPTTLADADVERLAEEAQERFDAVNIERADAPTLLARHALATGGSAIRLNDSKLDRPPRRTMSPRVKWALRAAVVTLLIAATGLYLWTDATARRDALQSELDAIRSTADELAQLQRDTSLASQWYDKRPPALECMLELTRTFPQQGAIRVETLTLREDMSGQIDCTASDRDTMDMYFNQMQASDALLNINRGPVRPSGGNSTWIDFSVAFRFDPKAKGQTP